MMRSVLARPAPLAALALALGACSADRPLAPAPPSLATGSTPVYQEPEPLPGESTSRCMKFDGLAVGKRWGQVPGPLSGSVVHTENYISMKVTDYLGRWGTGTATTGYYRHAVITAEPRYPEVLTGNSLRLDTIGVIFDFTGVPFTIGSVTFNFVDRSPRENMSLDDGGLHLGQIWNVDDWPSPLRVVTQSISPPIRGKVQISGSVKTLQIGGTNDVPAFAGDSTGLWLDMICAHKASTGGQQGNPTPT